VSLPSTTGLKYVLGHIEMERDLSIEIRPLAGHGWEVTLWRWMGERGVERSGRGDTLPEALEALHRAACAESDARYDAQYAQELGITVEQLERRRAAARRKNRKRSLARGTRTPERDQHPEELPAGWQPELTTLQLDPGELRLPPDGAPILVGEAALEGLEIRERRVLELLYGGLLPARGPRLMIAAVGRKLNITPERVRQLQNRALKKLSLAAGSDPIQRALVGLPPFTDHNRGLPGRPSANVVAKQQR
jgi:DNA-binding CsgD family transcriptional regulator